MYLKFINKKNRFFDMNLYAQIINVIIAVYRDNISVFFYYILLKNNKEWGVRRY